MTTDSSDRESVLKDINTMLVRLSKRAKVDNPSINRDLRCASLVELLAVKRIVYELLYNPPPRSQDR